MDLNNKIILVKGEDKTSSIQSIEQASPYQYTIQFGGKSKKYTYHSDNVQILHRLNTINPADYLVTIDGRPETNVSAMDDFGSIFKVFHKNGYKQTVEKSRVKLVRSCLKNESVNERFEYYKAVAHSISVRTDSGMSILGKHYDKIKFIRDDTMLAAFLSGETRNVDTGVEPQSLVFPFGFNKSQEQAVGNAISSKISVIEGPPGTGKTQTILSLIANLVPEGNKIAVVSNNNSATDNVYEKLDAEDLGFVAARLGRSSNKQEFVMSQATPSKEQLEEDLLSPSMKFQLEKDLFDSKIKIDDLLEKLNEKALLDEEIREVTTEQVYYRKYLVSYDSPIRPRFIFKPKSDRVLGFIGRIDLSLAVKPFSTKLIGLVLLGILPRKFYQQPREVILAMLKESFYDLRLQELRAKESKLKAETEGQDSKALSLRHKDTSMKLFKNYLSKKYLKNPQKTDYTEDDLWKKSEKFMQDYPVILSTTHSLRSSLSVHFVYDYVIIDEASQVDLATFVLALSCAKNVVVVGDQRQLPNVIDTESRRIDSDIFSRFSIPEKYRFSSHSALSVTKEVFGDDVPIQMLREHYRCHPLIIGFCNKMFYDNRLIILTPKSDSKEQPLSVWYTAAGNHARSDRINQRQIDVTLNEIIPAERLNTQDGSLGIVSPYRNHANELQDILKDTNTLSATVDKFQGRERDAIILNTVDNEITEFASSPNRLNVAISRARKQLIVVTNGNKNSISTGIDRLIDYIKYNNFEETESNTRSVFDYLYRSYYTNKTKKARGDSSKAEDLMYELLESIKQDGQLNIKILMEYPLHELCDTDILSQEEAEFAQHSRVDFVVFDSVSKKPILAIEVDGYEFHKAKTLKAHNQRQRDEKKNRILAKVKMPLMRFSTTGSGEKDRLNAEIRRLLQDN